VSSGRAGRIWAITAGVAAGAALVLATADRGQPPTGHHLPLLLLTCLFAVSDLAVFRLELGSIRPTLTLVEVPLVLGLLTLPPWQLVVAWLGGAAAVRIGVHHQGPVRVAYNLSWFALEAAAAAAVFRAVSAGRDLTGASTLLGAFAATLTETVLGLASVYLALAVATRRAAGSWSVGQVPAERGRFRTEQWSHLLFGLAATAVTTSSVLIGIILDRTDPDMLWLMVPPVGGVYLAGWVFAGQVRKQRRLALLRRSSELLTGLHTADAITALLRQIRHTLSAGVAALAYRPDRETATLALVAVGPEDDSGLQFASRPGEWERWTAVVPGRTPLIVSDPVIAGRVGRLIGQPALRQAMVVPLAGTDQVSGFLVVGESGAEARTFAADDLQVLGTLERLLSVGLVYGHLETSLRQARLLERQLRHRASHDCLTGLANRTYLSEHLEAVLGPDRGGPAACLFIDLDGFKSVNDRFGHLAGDQLLAVMAQRLVGCLRDGDLAARVGGDELAVIAQVGDDTPARAEATHLARRIASALAEPATVGSITVALSASIGVALSHPGCTPTELITAADRAMYEAKASGKGQVAVADRRSASAG
jgi:diguanylate cyclase (GGDEF)-like protein